MPLNGSKPVASGRQDFVEEEHDIDSVGEVAEHAEAYNASKSRGSSIALRPRNTRRGSASLRLGLGYGDETDHTFIASDDEGDADEEDEDDDEEEEEEDEEPNSDDAKFIDDSSLHDENDTESESGGTDDEVEIIHRIDEESNSDDSDIEVVPSESKAGKSAKTSSTDGPAKSKRKGTSSSQTSDNIRQHYTEHIFYSLQDIVEQVQSIFSAVAIVQWLTDFHRHSWSKVQNMMAI